MDNSKVVKPFKRERAAWSAMIRRCTDKNQPSFQNYGAQGITVCLSWAENFERFLLEYDDERSGGFEPLRAVPDDRTVVLGLVTSKKPQLESVAELRARIAKTRDLLQGASRDASGGTEFFK